MIRTEESMGPIHGVQEKENEKPRRKDNRGPLALLVFIENLFSFFAPYFVPYKRSCHRPKIMITTPPMILKRRELDENILPTPLTPKERIKKVRDIPRTKKSVFITTLLLLYMISPFSSLSAFPPDKNEK